MKKARVNWPRVADDSEWPRTTPNLGSLALFGGEAGASGDRCREVRRPASVDARARHQDCQQGLYELQQLPSLSHDPLATAGADPVPYRLAGPGCFRDRAAMLPADEGARSS